MSKKEFLTRAEILSFDDLEIKELEIPEWGGRKVLVRGMTGRDRDNWEASVYKQKGTDVRLNMKNARAKLVALCVVDEDGNRLFNDGDISTLGNKSAKALDRIFTFAQELSGISKDDIDELTKNSEEANSDDLW